MTAMHTTDNASELKRTLTLEYNKARQAAITTKFWKLLVGQTQQLKINFICSSVSKEAGFFIERTILLILFR